MARLVVAATWLCSCGAARRDPGRLRDQLAQVEGSLDPDPPHPSLLQGESEESVLGTAAGWDPLIHGDPKVMVHLASLVEARSASNLTRPSESCEALKAANFGGHNIGPVLWLTCQLWPKRFGDYPLRVGDVQDFASDLFMAGGLYASLMTLAQKRNNSEEFCWRRKWIREHLQPAGYSCPQDMNESLAQEALEEDDSGQIQEGRWSCQDSSENPGKICRCGRTDLPNFRMDHNDMDSLPEKARARINSVPDGCDMVSLGHCYGECPYGFEPSVGSSLLGGIFKPVCVTKCTESSHANPCGFGCANSAGSCAKVAGKQINEVVKAVSKVTAMVSGHPQIHTIVDGLIGLVEFTITVLAKLIRIVVKTWSILSSGKKKLSILIALLQFAAETGLPIVIDMFDMKSVFAKTAQMLIDLVNAEWNFGINIKVIGNVLKNHQTQSILTLYQLAKAFVWPGCKVSETTAIFSISTVGDSAMAGQWMRQGTHSGRPRYTKVGDSWTRIEWSDTREAWRAYHDKTWLGIGRKTLYRNTRNEIDVPYEGWQVDRGARPAPVLVKMGS